LADKALPLYGMGSQIHDLALCVGARALVKVATTAVDRDSYNIGGYNEKLKIELAHTLCDLLEELHP
jgi:dTDP-glucose 4,6-dehydratase